MGEVKVIYLRRLTPQQALHRSFSSSARWRMYSASEASLTVFWAAPPTGSELRVPTSRARPQLNRNFIDIPISEACLWEQFDDEQKRIVTQTLARLLVQATRDEHQEQTNEDRKSTRLNSSHANISY